MTAKRKEIIKKEAKRRLNEWLKNSTFDKMVSFPYKENIKKKYIEVLESSSYKYVKFCESIGLLNGYEFMKPEWMIDKKFKSCITIEEFRSDDYDEIMSELFELAQKNSVIVI